MHLGNIKLTIWHYTGIEENEHIETAFKNLALFLIVDISSFVLNGLFLWFTCGIHMLKVLSKIQKKLWFFMALMECSLFLEVKTDGNKTEYPSVQRCPARQFMYFYILRNPNEP